MVDHPNAILPDRIATGYTAGPEFLNSHVSLAGGYRTSNARRSAPVWRFDFNGARLPIETIKELQDFFIGRRGSLYSWLLKDLWNYQLVDEAIFVSVAGGETTAQIIKTHDASGNPYARTIRYIKAGTLKVYVDGTLDAGATQTNGLITLSAPLTIGQTVTVGSPASPTEYYTPVKFKSDFAGLAMVAAAPSLGAWSTFDAQEELE